MPARTRHEWVSLGASVRLQQLDEERAEIIRAFPHLKQQSQSGGSDLAKPRKRRKISAAARKAMSAGMRRYWARRRAEAAKRRTKKNGDGAE
jgi:hypothetical protein